MNHLFSQWGRLRLVGLLLCLLLVSCAASQNAKPAVTPTPKPPTLTVKWQNPLPLAGHMHFIIANNVIYASNDQQIYAVDTTTGTTLWSHAMPWPSQIFINGSTLAAATFSKYYVLDLQSGAVQSTLSILPFYAQGYQLRAYAANRLYMHTNSTVIAVDGTSGTILWKTALPTHVTLQNTMQDEEKLAPFTLSNGIIFIGNPDGTFIALDQNSGRLLWSVDTVVAKATDLIYFAPALASQNVVYTFSQRGRDDNTDSAFLYAVEISDHRLLWKKQINLGVGSQITLAAGRLIVPSISSGPSFEKSLVFLDPATGNILQAFHGPRPVGENLATDGTFVYTVAGDLGIFAVRIDDPAQSNRTPLESDLTTDDGPQLSNGMLYFATQQKAHNGINLEVLLAMAIS